MSAYEKHRLYASLASQTRFTVAFLQSQGMHEQANRHRECEALLTVLAIRYGQGGAS